MNKQQLIKQMAQDAGITQVAATAALNAFQDNVSTALGEGDTVKLVGFGTFKASVNPAHMARNPKTGEPVSVPAKMRVNFTAGKEFKSVVNFRRNQSSFN